MGYPLHAFLLRPRHLCREGLPRAALRHGGNCYEFTTMHEDVFNKFKTMAEDHGGNNVADGKCPDKNMHHEAEKGWCRKDFHGVDFCKFTYGGAGDDQEWLFPTDEMDIHAFDGKHCLQATGKGVDKKKRDHLFAEAREHGAKPADGKCPKKYDLKVWEKNTKNIHWSVWA